MRLNCFNIEENQPEVSSLTPGGTEVIGDIAPFVGNVKNFAAGAVGLFLVF